MNHGVSLPHYSQPPCSQPQSAYSGLWTSAPAPAATASSKTLFDSHFPPHFCFTLHPLQYCEFKRYKIAKGEKLTHATQYHDVMSHHAGKIIGYTAEVFVILQLIGTGIAQVWWDEGIERSGLWGPHFTACYLYFLSSKWLA